MLELSKVISIVLALFFSIPVFAEGTKMTMEDLKALRDQGSWQELTSHLGDIAPAQRKAEWEALAQESALGLLQAVPTSKDPWYPVVQAEGLMQKFPSVKKSKEFMKKRGELGLKVFKKCYENEWAVGQCTEHLTSFLADDPENREIAFQAGKLVRLKSNHYNAMPFFDKAIASKSDIAFCKDEDLKLAVIAALGLPTTGEGDAVKVKSAQRVVGEICLNDLKGDLKAHFSNSGGYFQQNACVVLKGKSVLANLQEKKCK